MRRAAVVMAFALAACGGPVATPAVSEETPSPGVPSATASATPPDPSATEPAPATPAPTASPSPASGGAALAVDALAEVIVTELVVRSAPGVDAATSTILDGRLTIRDRVFVVRGPVEADGYGWYQVGPLTRADGSAAPFGWIAAASREGDTWVRPVAAPCPGIVDIAPILDMQPLERLACYGDSQLALTAPYVSCGMGGGPVAFEPSWLFAIGGCGLALDTSGDAVLVYRVPPGVTAPTAPGGPATVVGHFDDPASATCRATSSDPSDPAPGPDEAVLMCRTQFVAESS